MTDQTEIKIGDTVTCSEEGVRCFGTGLYQLGYNIGVVICEISWNKGWYKVEWYPPNKPLPKTNNYQPTHLKHAIVSLEDLL